MACVGCVWGVCGVCVGQLGVLEAVTICKTELKCVEKYIVNTTYNSNIVMYTYTAIGHK